MSQNQITNNNKKSSVTKPIPLVNQFLDLLGFRKVQNGSFAYPPNGEIIMFLDKADGKLKYKDSSGKDTLLQY